MIDNQNQPAFTKEDLKQIHKEKLEFCKTTLGLDDKKAQEWAQRTANSLNHEE